MSSPIKKAILRPIERCGYFIQKSSERHRMLIAHHRLDQRAQQAEAELAAMCNRAQQAEAQLVEARRAFERTASALADARMGHEYALRELEQTRADSYELRDQLAQSLDENRRLKKRVSEL